MAKITKKQRLALAKIDELIKSRKRDQICGVASIVAMVVVIAAFNLLASLGVIDIGDPFARGVLYVLAMVAAGASGVFLMHASQKQGRIEGYRQQVGLSRETLEQWKNGEIE